MSLQAPESRFSKIQTGVFTYTRLFREAFRNEFRHEKPRKAITKLFADITFND